MTAVSCTAPVPGRAPVGWTAGRRPPVIGGAALTLEPGGGPAGPGAAGGATAARRPDWTNTAAAASPTAATAIRPVRPWARHTAGSPTHGTRTRATPRTADGATCTLSSLWLASPRVTRSPDASKETSRWSRSPPGRPGSSTRSTWPTRSSAAVTGWVSTTSPGWTRGAMEPLVTTCADQPTACGTSAVRTRPASPVSASAATQRATRVISCSALPR